MQFRTKSFHSMGRMLAIVVLSVVTLSACSSSNDDSDADGMSDSGDAGTAGTAGTAGDAGTEGDTAGTEGDTAGTEGGTAGTEGDTAGTDGDSTDSFAFVSGATISFDAGQIERLTLGESITASGAYPATMSDIRVRTDGTDVYQVGRRDLDSITRFTTENLTTPTYQYSVLQGETSPNTIDIVFLNETKAYVLQRGGTDVLIVNPSAATDAEFITGSLDISAYDTDAPEAVRGIIANGKLFVLMQRMEGFNPVRPGYVAVFNTETDMEIDTNMGNDGLKGIALTTLNPTSLQYVASSNDVLVNGDGNINVSFNELPGDPYSGGIEAIDADDYSLEMLLDDGTEANNNGFFAASVQATDTRGYVITSVSFRNNTLRSYNVTTGMLEEGIVAGLDTMDLTTLAVGPAGRVWVGLGGMEPGFILINPADNSVAVEKVATEFVPNHVVFVEGAR